jgi:hypothetical protein
VQLNGNVYCWSCFEKLEERQRLHPIKRDRARDRSKPFVHLSVKLPYRQPPQQSGGRDTVRAQMAAEAAAAAEQREFDVQVSALIQHNDEIARDKAIDAARSGGAAEADVWLAGCDAFASEDARFGANVRQVIRSQAADDAAQNALTEQRTAVERAARIAAARDREVNTVIDLRSNEAHTAAFHAALKAGVDDATGCSSCARRGCSCR